MASFFKVKRGSGAALKPQKLVDDSPQHRGVPYNLRHPDYIEKLPEWETMRDAVAGTEVVKLKGEQYLPMPAGFAAMPDGGAKAYADYKLRAQFPDEITEPTIRGMLGVITKEAPNIDLPSGMEYLREAATADRIPLDHLYRRVVRENLTTGRLGLLTDAPAAGGNPYLSLYNAESIVNWSGMGDLFVLDESGNIRNDKWWRWRKQWRVLEIDANGDYTVTLYGDDHNGEAGDNTQTPQGVGARKLSEIPFVVIGSLDLTPDIDEVPLIGVARAAFSVYRLDADYRHQLYNSGQETFVIAGNIPEGDEPTVLGSSVILVLPENATAKYVSPSCATIAQHESAIEKDRAKAIMAGARLFETAPEQESGEAKRIRYGAQTATLISIAMNSAQGLEKALRNTAIILGQNPEQVKVTPNTSFVDSDMSIQDAVAAVDLWQSGTLSKRTVYERLQRGGVANKDREFEEEQDEVKQDEIDNPRGNDAEPPPGEGAE